MNTRKRAAAVTAALATAVTGAVLVPAQVDAAARVPTIKATVTKKAIHLSTSTVRAGLVRFTVTVPSGDHSLQLLRLHKGYTPQKLQRDLGRAFTGHIKAIKRVDRRVTWASGAEAKPKHPGRFAQDLRAGTYFVVDQNGPAAAMLHVTGPRQHRGGIATSSTIVGTGKDRFRSPRTIPHHGWTLFKDTSDEPHFLVMQHVKRGTTRADVRKFINSGAQGNPPFVRRGEASSGVISGGTHTLFHYNLPRGRYVLICFWPSDETGMPHAAMGMYRLVNLR